ncbi:phosphomevalonate kinase [Streptomyces cellulosae]
MKHAPRSVTVKAPGKLMIAGEYAVLTPGCPAIVATVDRYVTVTAAPCQACDRDIELDTDLLPHPVHLRRTTTGLEAVHTQDARHVDGKLARLVAVVETLDALRANLGLAPIRARLVVRSSLHEQGVKLGLGSSGAVVAGAVHALTEFAGPPLPPEARFRLAMLAGVALDAAPSGADIAAAVWHGWIAYSPPDRAALRAHLRHHSIRDTLCAPWSGLSIQALPTPAHTTVQIGWTGRPAVTTEKVNELRSTSWWTSRAHHDFCRRSTGLVNVMRKALETHDSDLFRAAIGHAHDLLADLDATTRLGIFTPHLTSLCHIAQDLGAAAKPSGAGGGDCGIALPGPATSLQELRRRWKVQGITPLQLSPALLPAAHPSPPAEVGPHLSAPTRHALSASTERTCW